MVMNENGITSRNKHQYSQHFIAFLKIVIDEKRVNNSSGLEVKRTSKLSLFVLDVYTSLWASGWSGTGRKCKYLN